VVATHRPPGSKSLFEREWLLNVTVKLLILGGMVAVFFCKIISRGVVHVHMVHGIFGRESPNIRSYTV